MSALDRLSGRGVRELTVAEESALLRDVLRNPAGITGSAVVITRQRRIELSPGLVRVTQFAPRPRFDLDLQATTFARLREMVLEAGGAAVVAAQDAALATAACRPCAEARAAVVFREWIQERRNERPR